MRVRRHGICGCGRKIRPQRDHNDPEIWGCISCSGPVCDYCYHIHYEQKHLPAFVLGDPKSSIKAIFSMGAWLRVEVRDGRMFYVRREHFKRLRDATFEQLEKYELLGGGEGVHWPDLDEDISIRGFLKYAEDPQGVVPT